ncbi:MAG TPA: glycosyltransferase [Sneathiellales bacterium]|nr:glycosyltransferase [Sneathiellales bacterium]
MNGDTQSTTAPPNSKPGLGRSVTPTILQIIPEMEIGGAEQGTIDVAIAIKKAGWNSVVVSNGGVKTADLARGDVTHHELPVHSKNPWVVWRNASRLEHLIAAHNVDVVHVRSRAPAWSAYLAAKRTGRPLVTTFHGTYNENNRLKHLYNSVMTRGDRVIAISDFIANHVQERFGIEGDKLVTVRRGIDLRRFNPGAVNAQRMIQLSSLWRVPDGARVIMLPGRLTRWKGQLLILDALMELDRDDAFVLMVGDDQGRFDYRDELDARIRNLGLGDRVRIMDDCQDMPAAYMLADVVVSASIDPEAFGRVPVEGQAMGRPVVAARHGGAIETVFDGVTGWLVQPSDPKALAWGIRQALDLSNSDRAEMAEAARAWVEERFTVDRMCEQTIEVYRSLMSDK